MLDFVNSNWEKPFGTVESEEGALYVLNNSSFYVASAPVGTLAVNEVATYVINLVCPDDQELGIYNNGSPAIAQTFTYNGIGLAQTFIDRISVVRRGPMVASDTVYQTVASDTFIDCDIASQAYFISAWICPGLPDPTNQCSANLTVVRCNKEGKPKAALSVRIDNNNLLFESNERNPETGIASYPVYNSGEYINIGPGITPVNPGDPASFSFCLDPNTHRPICGISGDPIIAKDDTDPTKTLTFYRVYFKFKPGESLATDSFGMSIPPEEQDKIAILLTQSANEHNTASTTVYFDGIKLEKSMFEDQDRPTTYHKNTTLISPSTGLDVSGKHKFYEW